MKSIKRVTSLAVAIMFIAIFLVTPVIFAAEGGTLEFLVDKTVPASGSNTMPVENAGIKLYFGGDVTAPSVWENNKESFSLRENFKRDSEGKVITDDDGKIVHEENGKEVDVLAYSDNAVENNYILVVALPEPKKEGQPGQLEPNSPYTLTISADLGDVNGNTLGEEKTVEFTTIDVAGNSRISMYFMVAMIVGIIVIMVLSNYRKAKAEVEAKELEKANPYKIAKDRGISVEEATALIEKAKEKNRKKLEKAGVSLDKDKEKEAPQIEAPQKATAHKVNGPRPISEAGSSYKTGRKAIAEKKAKAEAAIKAAKASSGSKGTSNKGKKGKSNKKK